MMNIRNLTIISFVIIVTISCASFQIPDDYPDNNPDQDYSRPNDFENDFSVTIYEHSDFRGRSETHILGDRQRHLLIDFVGWDLNDRISSIRCGRRVGVALFRDRDFRGPVAIYDDTTETIDNDINDWASSMIVFDLDQGGPLGVWLGERGDASLDVFNSSFSGNVRFYPMSEDVNEYETGYYRLNEFNDNVEWVVLGPADRRDYRRARNYGRDHGRERYNDRDDRRYHGRQLELEVFIYEHSDYKGRSIALPPRLGMGKSFNLMEHNFNRMASSIVIKEVSRRYNR